MKGDKKDKGGSFMVCRKHPHMDGREHYHKQWDPDWKEECDFVCVLVQGRATLLI